MSSVEIEQIFHRFDNRQVNKTLDEANDKYQSIKLAKQLGNKIELDIKDRLKETVRAQKEEETKRTASLV